MNTLQTHNITRQVVVKKKAAGDDVHRVNAFS